MNESTYPKDTIRPGYQKTETPAEDPSSGKAAIELIDPQRLWQRTIELRYWLIGIFAVAISLAIIYTILQTPMYLATSRIEISRVDAGSANIDELALEGEARDQQYYETQYVLLKSRFLADRVVEAENLARKPSVLAALGFPEDGNPSPRNISSALLSRVEIKPLDRSNLVDIAFTSSSPAVSAELSNAWAEQFLRANFDKRFGDTVEARRQLEEQLAEMREKLEISEAELIAYANANGIVALQQSVDSEGVASSQTLIESQLSALNDALAQATARRITAESAVRAGASDVDTTTALRSRIAEVEATLARLTTTLGPENSQVQASRAELQSLRSALSQQSGLSGAARSAALRAAQREEAELQSRFEQAKDRYLRQQGQGVQYGILQREVSTNRELYNALLQRYKELGVAASGRNNMTVIEEASPPGGPYSPSLINNVLIALVVSLILSGLLVLLRDLLDNTVRDPHEIRVRLGQPVLGLIPRFDDGSIEDQLLDPHSELSEAYASSRVAIDFAGKPDDKVVLVTSTRPDEGKSLSSLALAYNFARPGKKVLLIDMDLRRKGLSIRLKETKQEAGMAAYLAGQIDTLPTVHMEQFGLDFVRAGNTKLNPADILATPRTEMALEKLKEIYDYIVIDAPPILGLADTPQLARAVDSMVYIVQANASTFRSVKQAMSRLRATQDKLLGVIVTKLDERNQSYAYGYGYGYGYSYKASPVTDGAA